MTFVPRRLVAILIADVVGYTRMMEADDAGTFARLRSIRDEVVDPAIGSHGGRIVKTAGDGLLAEFPSVVAALQAAEAIQRTMAERNVGIATERRIDYRIGVNLGDIIIDGDDIAGDGVNVASRLETLAEPGGICVSAAVHEQFHGRPGISFIDLGEQRVKNIERPIRVYRVALDGDAPTGSKGVRRHPQRAKLSWVAAGALLLMLAGAAAVWLWPSRNDAAAAMGPPLMSVAVMPFSTAPGDPAEAGLAEALPRDITGALGQGGWASPVVSYGLAADARGKATDPRALGRDLGVRFLLEGGLRTSGERLTVDVRLVETSGGTQIWADRVTAERQGASGESLQLAAQVASRVRRALYQAEGQRVSMLPKAAATAAELVLQARALRDRDRSLTALVDQRRIYEEALRLQPDFVDALLGLSFAVEWIYIEDPTADKDQAAKELDAISLRLIRAKPDDPRAWTARQIALELQRKTEAAIDANAEALRIDPYNTSALTQRGYLEMGVGRPENAFQYFDRAIALDPGNPGVATTLWFECRANLTLGRNTEAVRSCEKSLARNDHWLPYLYLVATHTQLGNRERAAAAKAELLRRQPAISIAWLKSRRLSDHPEYLLQMETHILEPLRKAGLPEQ
jgi:class 3 adenylate cyclase/TolB-like protein